MEGVGLQQTSLPKDALLDSRFPQQEKVDELGEILGEVFAIRVKEGETMKIWAARSQEVFEKCKLKTNVSFPDQARGRITLHRSGLTEEQKTVVIAHAGGDLNRKSVSAALRSCYPDLVYKKGAVASVEEVFSVEGYKPVASVESDFADVTGLLEDHGGEGTAVDEDFPETDVAEVLAATWKEKRAVLARLKRSGRGPSVWKSKSSRSRLCVIAVESEAIAPANALCQRVLERVANRRPRLVRITLLEQQWLWIRMRSMWISWCQSGVRCLW